MARAQNPAEEEKKDDGNSVSAFCVFPKEFSLWDLVSFFMSEGHTVTQNLDWRLFFCMSFPVHNEGDSVLKGRCRVQPSCISLFSSAGADEMARWTG